MSRKNMSGKIMSAFDVAVQPEHVTDKEYIGTLLAQIKAQQETYNILYNRNLVLYNELKTMNAYAVQQQMPKVPEAVMEAVMEDLTKSHASIADLWKVTEGNKIIASDAQENDERLARDSNDGNTHSSSQ
jgi:multimeric flavodoxin WrbA